MSSLTISNFNVPVGNNKVLVVLSKSSQSQAVFSMSFNGTNLVRLGSPVSNANARAEVWYLVLGQLSNNFTGNITATYTAANTYIGITAASFSGVNQSAPLNGLISNNFGTSATSSSLSTTGATGDMAIEAISSIGNGSQPPVFTPGSSQTSIAICNSTPTSTFGQSAVIKAQTGNSQTLGWSVSSISSGTTNGIQIAANIQNVVVVLPVKLTKFTAAKQGSTSLLSWKVAQEENIATYTIERSADGRRFTTVGSIASLGNTSLSRTYSFPDASPIKGANYYRLKITEKHGKVSYSEVRLLNFGSQISIALYPNPVKDKATLTGVEAGMHIRLLDAVGKVLRVQIANSTAESIVLSGLSEGFYSVQVYGTNGQLLNTARLVKE